MMCDYTDKVIRYIHGDEIQNIRKDRKMKIVESMLTNNSCYKIGKPITVQGLMLHSIGCPQPRAEVFARGWNDPAKEVAVHGFIDGLTGNVWQFLPWDICGWHAGGAANQTHIGVEMGEPDCIRYKPSSATFTVKDTDRAAAVACALRTYNAAVELFAYLCGRFGLDPTADGVIIGHAEGHARGIASNHGDPEHLWRQLGMDKTMDGFRRDVAAKFGKVAPTPEPVQGGTVYTVRTGDTLSGIGARFGVDWRTLVTANGIIDPSLIYPGQRLTIPGAEAVTYTVKPGDSLWRIAKEYLGAGIRYGEIVRANGMTEAAIHPGDVLIIPRR